MLRKHPEIRIMNMLENIFGYGFRVNYAHPICSSRRRLLRHSAALQSYRFIDSPYVACTLLAASLLAIMSFVFVLARGGSPQIDGFSRQEVLRHLSLTLNQPSAREASLARINLEQSRRSASITHFISEIVSKHQRGESITQAQKIASAIVTESTRLGFDPLFVASVIKYESTFNPFARSSAGAVGLMQMLPSTGHFISRASGLPTHVSSNLLDPAVNIKLGILYLAHLRSKFRGNKEQMLIAYNWGPENLARALRQRQTPPASTIHYARRVLTHHRDWQRSFEAQSSRYRHFDFARVMASAKDKSVG